MTTYEKLSTLTPLDMEMYASQQYLKFKPELFRFARAIEARVERDCQKKIAELESQLEAIGAGGVTRLMGD